MIAISLEKKVVIVTGAAQGIGRAIALRMAEAGCAGLVINDLKINDIAKATAKDAEAFGAKVLLHAGDMSNENSVKELISVATNKFGRLDVMVNNAGISISNDLFGTTADDWDLVIRVNMISMFLGMKYAAEYMKEHGGGVG